MDEYIKRKAALEECDWYANEFSECEYAIMPLKGALEIIPAADVRPVPEGGIGEMSDGYHTFNGLYYQRMVLFAALVKAYKDKAWKSWKHEDGELCFGGGWFVVGIDTPEGSYTYHYDGKDWDRFDCVALPEAKHWDGHTEKDVTRLLSLPEKAKWINLTPPECREDGKSIFWMCSECRSAACFVAEDLPYSYCPNCGARMEENWWNLNLARFAGEKAQE